MTRHKLIDFIVKVNIGLAVTLLEEVLLGFAFELRGVALENCALQIFCALVAAQHSSLHCLWR
jgi:hypothetical protein